MKKILLLAFVVCFCTAASAQVTLTQLPKTPLEYFGYEVTSPALKAGYTKRTQYFGQKPFVLEIGSVVLRKYADLPIYDLFSEKSEFFSYVESKTSVSRKTGYVAYTLEVRSSDSGPYAVYAKDTFFLSGTTITSISETIYDTEDNTVDTYAQYDVTYHSNGKVERIKLKDIYSGSDLFFAGVSVVYNANNTLKTDTLFKFGYDGLGNRKVNVSIYQDHFYKSSNALKIDSTFYSQIGSNPVLNTKFSYTLNTNSEITEAIGASYNSSNGKYENNFYYDFGQEPSLGILSQTTVSTVTLYPNPVQDLIHIPADCSFQSWSITSITGLAIKNGTNTDLNKITVADLEAGVYVLTLTGNGQAWTGKFIK